MLGRAGPYELLEEIGRGGMGAVYRARDGRTGREVALKALLTPAVGEEVARFRLEAEAAARLDHPGVVRVLDAGIEAARPFLVMELVRGESARARLRRAGRLPPTEAAALGAALADALAHAHARGVLHRDVKPENVLLSAEGPRLTDFGLARLAGSGRLTATGQVLGTPSYMPPEQAEGQWPRIGPWSDVYSLGATLFELLTGDPPYRGTSALQVLSQVLSKDVPSPRALRPELDPALEAVVVRCLQKDPARRYPTADALAAALRAWSASAATGPATTASGVRTRAGRARGDRARRGRRLVATLAALGAAGLGLALALATRARRTTPSAPASSSATSTAPRDDGATATEVAALVSRAEAALVAQRNGEAEDLADEVLRRDPRSARALFVRGTARGRRGALREALADLDRALALQPLAGAVHSARASVRAMLGDLPAALADADLGVALRDQAAARLVRATIRGNLRFERGAQADIDAALALDPQDPNPYVERSLVRRAKGDLRGALADLDRALELGPDAARAIAARAGTRMMASDDAGALADARRWAALVPEEADPHLLVCQLHVFRGELGLAVEALAEGARRVTGRTRAETRSMLGRMTAELMRTLAARGDLAGAEALAAKVLAGAPEELGVWTTLAELRLGHGDAAGAAEAVGRAVALDPQDLVSLRTRAMVRAHLGDAAGALQDLDAVRARGAEDLPMLVVRGHALADVGRTAEAARVLHEVARREGGDPTVHGARLDVEQRLVAAWDLIAARRPQDAIERCTAALIDAAPEAPLGWSTRARYRLLLGDTSEAEADARAALERDRRDGRALVVLAECLVRRGDPVAAREALAGARAALPSRHPDLEGVSPRLRSLDEAPGAKAPAGDFMALYYRSQRKTLKGDLTGALADLDEAIRLARDPPPQLHLERAETLFALGRLEEAALAAERAREVAPGDPQVLVRCGALRRRQRDPGAREDFERALAACAGDDVLSLALRATVLLYLGDPAAGLRAFDRAVELEPAEAELLLQRAHARRWLKDFAKAREDLDACARLAAETGAEHLRGAIAQELGWVERRDWQSCATHHEHGQAPR